MPHISLSDILHNRPSIEPQIYGYIIPTVPDHTGYVKIGYTDRADVENGLRNNCIQPLYHILRFLRIAPCAKMELVLQIGMSMPF